jgi:hypothetical protein
LMVFENRSTIPSSNYNIEEINHMVKSLEVDELDDKKQHIH